jgi:hypothetical protein
VRASKSISGTNARSASRSPHSIADRRDGVGLRASTLVPLRLTRVAARRECRAKEEPMNHALVSPAPRSLRFVGAIVALVVACTLGLASCTVRLISDYDEVTVQKTNELQERCESLFVSLQEAAATGDIADDLYPAHAQQYEDIEVALRILESRAAVVKKGEITEQQVELLRKSIKEMQDAHRLRSNNVADPKGLSEIAVQAARDTLAQQFHSILVLQEGLKNRVQ